MSRPPKEPDVVWVCPCGNRVRIPARIRGVIPTCNGGTDHRHRTRQMRRDTSEIAFDQGGTLSGETSDPRTAGTVGGLAEHDGGARHG